jgi:long-chain acyl-CoA synthetase
MNDRDKNRPALSLAEAHALLTAPGAAFETVEVQVRGVPMPVWKHAPATAAEAFARARRHGPSEFLVYQDERVSYEGFARACVAVARLLATRRIAKGDRVALAMRNLPEWPVVFMGALLAGAIAVPLNARWSGPELEFALRDSGARFLFADAHCLARVSHPAVEHIFVSRAGDPVPGATSLEEVIGVSKLWQELPDYPLPAVTLSPEDDATIFYTSGTTGATKGALGTHRSLTTNIFAMPFSTARNALRWGSEVAKGQRTTLLAVPFFHVIGSLSVLLPGMVAGGKLVLMRKFEAREALDLIAREKVTVTGGVPAVALSLLEAPGDDDLSSLQLVTYGGAPSPASLPHRIRTRFRAMPGQGWGMTETSATCTSHSGEDYLRRPSSCGPALPVSRVKIMKDGAEQPPGVAGELWAFGPNVVKGYWNRPDATAEIFRDGWVKTGDIALLDGEGFCTILDRAQDMLIRGGENIYCPEVEHVLAQHPAVADAVLVGLPHPVLGEVPAALVQARPGMALSERTLQDFAAQRLAAFKVPVRVHVSRAALPRNDGGKLVKTGLREIFDREIPA